MAVLNIRRLPAATHARLRVRAARAGRSMEAEARDILTKACGQEDAPLPASALAEWVDRLYAGRKPGGVTDALIAERRREGRRR